jgi:hypothetical protein
MAEVDGYELVVTRYAFLMERCARLGCVLIRERPNVHIEQRSVDFAVVNLKAHMWADFDVAGLCYDFKVANTEIPLRPSIGSGYFPLDFLPALPELGPKDEEDRQERSDGGDGG